MKPRFLSPEKCRQLASLIFFTLSAQALFSAPAPALVWDSDKKEHTAQPGDDNAKIIFGLTNVSAAAVTVNSARTSCGCSIAKMPAQPWVLAPGANGQIEVTMDLRGKRGKLSKSLTLDTTEGSKHATFTVTIPGEGNPGSGFAVPGAGAAKDANAPRTEKTASTTESIPMADRLDNQRRTFGDRQIVFKGECAKCHAEPAKDKTGRELFVAACAICHDTPHRATMVLDLFALTKPVDTRYWRTWITDEQIATLVEYLVTQPQKRAAAGK